jgi:hypothetical protein
LGLQRLPGRSRGEIMITREIAGSAIPLATGFPAGLLRIASMKFQPA